MLNLEDYIGYGFKAPREKFRLANKMALEVMVITLYVFCQEWMSK